VTILKDHATLMFDAGLQCLYTHCSALVVVVVSDYIDLSTTNARSHCGPGLDHPAPADCVSALTNQVIMAVTLLLKASFVLCSLGIIVST